MENVKHTCTPLPTDKDPHVWTHDVECKACALEDEATLKEDQCAECKEITHSDVLAFHGGRCPLCAYKNPQEARKGAISLFLASLKSKGSRVTVFGDETKLGLVCEEDLPTLEYDISRLDKDSSYIQFIDGNSAVCNIPDKTVLITHNASAPHIDWIEELLCKKEV